MLDPWIIEEIKKKEEERKRNEIPPTIEIPRKPELEKPNDQDGNGDNGGESEKGSVVVVDGDAEFGIVQRPESNKGRGDRTGEITF